SIIQVLLLLRQTFQKNRLEKGLSLNKPLCYLGEGKDALYEFADSNIISFEIDECVFSFETERALESDFLKVTPDNQPFENKKEQFESLFGINFQYISAARLANYIADDYAVDNEKQISIDEGKAELTAHFLHKYQKQQVSDILLHPTDLENKDLLYQATLWEREISEDVNIIPQKVGMSYEIKYTFNTNAALAGVKQEFTAKNVGFGLSYALPIIVAILSAQKGALLLIENPEAHLHPYGQAKLTELMCLAAEAGIQIIIETHSDHIINGALVACKQGKIKKENISIYQFSRDEEQHCVKATQIEVLEGGRIKKVPNGFFDQINKDLRILMR
ncbi:MAG: DUF3696 domain-containing protein, partial [Bacteroidetes bacterium]